MVLLDYEELKKNATISCENSRDPYCVPGTMFVERMIASTVFAPRESENTIQHLLFLIRVSRWFTPAYRVHATRLLAAMVAITRVDMEDRLELRSVGSSRYELSPQGCESFPV